MTNNQKLKKIFYDFDRADFTEFAANIIGKSLG